jgi:hypothetical protein
MELGGWIAFGLGLYGSFLSTYHECVARKARKRQVRVEVGYGAGVGPERWPSSLFSTASNPGDRAVTLSEVALLAPDGCLLLTVRFAGVKLPYELGEGKSCSHFLETEALAEELVSCGYRGIIKLRVLYADALGNEYKSRPFEFDAATVAKAEA